MKKIVCLHTGDYVIAEVEQDIDLSQQDQEIVLQRPMFIVQTLSDPMAVGFKLEDMTLFSSDRVVVIKPRDVLTVMNPLPALSQYYDSIDVLNDLAIRPMIEEQIIGSIVLIQDSIDELKYPSALKNSRFSKITN